MADKTSIDDLFESDDDDYTIETDGSPEDDIDLDDEDYSQYLVDDTDEVVNSKAPVEEKTLEDEFNELKQQQSQKTEETPVETQTSDEEEIEKTEQKLTDDEILETTATSDDVIEETEDENGDVVSEQDVAAEEIIDESNEIEDDDEPADEAPETADDDKTIAEIINENKEEPVVEVKQPEIIKANTDEYFEALKENVGTKLNGVTDEEERYAYNKLIDMFREQVQAYFKKYHETDLVNYITYHATPEDKQMFKEIYIREYCKYSLAIDFENELAESNLWVIAAGKFADQIEFLKSVGQIQSSVEVEDNMNDYNSKIIEDKQVAINREYKKTQKEKFDKIALDRTIFEIDDSEDNNYSIFDDKRSLEEEFSESKFFKIHTEVMKSDRYADMSKVQSKVICNENTSYHYMIDYSTGVRVFCIDTKDVDQYHTNPMLTSRRIPFTYPERARDFKLRILYSDDAENRTVSVVHSLKKLIAYEFYKDRYKIKINGNYVVAYTTEPQWVEMFEKGDPDSKKPDNSTYYLTKPSNMCIGIIILNKKTFRDRQTIRRNQIARDIGYAEEIANSEDYDIQFLLSARIIRNDLRLRNPTLPKEDRYVEYCIVQYTEANPVIITDGLQTIIACIIKEHLENYAPGTPYSVTFEYDKDSLVSPAVIRLLDEHDGLEPAYGQRVSSPDVDGQFTLPPSRLKMDGVFPFEYGRLDKRNFSPVTIQRKYPSDLWKKYDLSTRDGKIAFIRSRGFEEFLHPRPVVFDVMPYALNFIEQSETTANIIKVSLPMLADRNSYDHDLMMHKQNELLYKQSLGNTPYGNFKLFVIEAVNTFIDTLAEKNNQN